MLDSNPMIELRGSVYFESSRNLEITGHILSENVFESVPFSGEIPGLRDEVPALRLTKEVFGLAFVLFGNCEGECCNFTLTCGPGGELFQRLVSNEKITIDIGKWLTQLVQRIPELRVTGCSPAE